MALFSLLIFILAITMSIIMKILPPIYYKSIFMNIHAKYINNRRKIKFIIWEIIARGGKLLVFEFQLVLEFLENLYEKLF